MIEKKQEGNESWWTEKVLVQRFFLFVCLLMFFGLCILIIVHDYIQSDSTQQEELTFLVQDLKSCIVQNQVLEKVIDDFGMNKAFEEYINQRVAEQVQVEEKNESNCKKYSDSCIMYDSTTECKGIDTSFSDPEFLACKKFIPVKEFQIAKFCINGLILNDYIIDGVNHGGSGESGNCYVFNDYNYADPYCRYSKPINEVAKNYCLNKEPETENVEGLSDWNAFQLDINQDILSHIQFDFNGSLCEKGFTPIEVLCACHKEDCALYCYVCADKNEFMTLNDLTKVLVIK